MPSHSALQHPLNLCYPQLYPTKIAIHMQYKCLGKSDLQIFECRLHNLDDCKEEDLKEALDVCGIIPLIYNEIEGILQAAKFCAFQWQLNQ